MERIVTQQEVEPRTSLFGTKLPAPMEITEVLDSSNLVTMVTTGGNENGYISGYTSTTHKLPPSQQVIVKLIEGNSSSLDMVRVISEDEVDSTSGPLQSFSILSRESPISVHKLSGTPLSNSSGGTMPHQYSNAGISEVKCINTDTNSSTRFTVWTCAYCRLVFPTASAIARHQERNCSQNPNQNTQISVGKSTQVRSTQMSSPLLQHTYAKLDVIKKSNIISEKKMSGLSVDKNSNLESLAITNSENISEELVNEDDFDLIWNCAICNEEFKNDNDLGEHLLSHSKQELSTALIKSSVPSKKKKVCGNVSEDLGSGMKDELLNKSIEMDSDIGHENEDSSSEENVDYPDTITLQNKHSYTKITKRKPGPKPQPKEKREKRRYVRKKPMKTGQEKKTSPDTGSRDPHTCYVCHKVLSSRGNLAKHIVQHKENKPYICQLCGQGFNAKRDQQHHILYKHTNERPHKCELCGKCYGDARVLAEHKKFHNEAREYSCDICGKTYRTAKCVARHKKRHKQDKNFTCEQCFKPFVVKADLKSHIHKVHKTRALSIKRDKSQILDILAIKSPIVRQHFLQDQQPTSFQVLTVQQSHMQENRSKEASSLVLTGGGSSTALLQEPIFTNELDPTPAQHYTHSQRKEIAISDGVSIGGTYTALSATTDGTETMTTAEPYIMINQGEEESQITGGSHPGLNIIHYTTHQHQVHK